MPRSQQIAHENFNECVDSVSEAISGMRAAMHMLNFDIACNAGSWRCDLRLWHGSMKADQYFGDHLCSPATVFFLARERELSVSSC